jgi:putative oxygen-independent coproporphyrinogen III oxidase
LRADGNEKSERDVHGFPKFSYSLDYQSSKQTANERSMRIGILMTSLEPDSATPWLTPRSAYIHIPFCAHHCGYCDFAVTAGQDHLIDLYLEALAAEMSALELPRPVRTLFLGGGTPSHLGERQLDRLFGELDRWLPRERRAEVSLEANPDSFDADKARQLAELGINRVSLGVQSFQPNLLRVLERQHEPAHVGPAVEAAKRFIGRLSIDLIFGVPGQTLEQWAEDLRQAIALEPEHISTYGLTFEKGTRLWKMQQRDEVRSIGEESELAMYQLAMETLENSGFEQYEISSFARPGGRCIHNQVYWANEAFYGFGVGAAAYANGTRTLNVRNTQDYIRRVLSGEPPVFQSETLSPEERARETLSVNLRRAEGVLRERFRAQTGFDADELAGVALAPHVAAGLLIDDGASIRLTRAGRCVADSIVTDVL